MKNKASFSRFFFFIFAGLKILFRTLKQIYHCSWYVCFALSFCSNGFRFPLILLACVHRSSPIFRSFLTCTSFQQGWKRQYCRQSDKFITVRQLPLNFLEKYCRATIALAVFRVQHRLSCCRRFSNLPAMRQYGQEANFASYQICSKVSGQLWRFHHSTSFCACAVMLCHYFMHQLDAAQSAL